jgi:hypothetical protein
MKKILLLVTSAAIAFGIVGAAASSLGTFSAFNVPAAATQTINAACSSGATLDYSAGTNPGDVNSIVLDLNDAGACAGKTIAWKVGSYSLLAGTVNGTPTKGTKLGDAGADAYVAVTNADGSGDTVITVTRTSAPAGWTAAQLTIDGNMSITLY